MPVDSFFCFFGGHCNTSVFNSTMHSSLFLISPSTPLITHCWPPLIGNGTPTCFPGRLFKFSLFIPPQNLLLSHSSIRHLFFPLCLDSWSCVCVLSHFSHVGFLGTLWTIAHQAPLSMGFLPGEPNSSGLPWPPPGDLPDPGIKTNVSYISCIGSWVLYH